MALGHERLIRKLQSANVLSETELSMLRSLPLTARSLASEEEIVREGDRPSDCCLVVEGLLVRQKTTPEGRRQILSIHTPGDLADLQSLQLPMMDHSIAAVGRATLALIPHPQVEGLLQSSHRLAQAFAREALVDAAIHREWILNLGARSAHQRTAHLLCEIFFKMRAVGLTTGQSCPLPLSQRDLADCMGLSPVHVNRMLQDMRSDGLIGLVGKVLTVPDLKGLQAVGQFDPTYLHLQRPEAA